MELHQTKKLLHSKGNSHQPEDTAHRMEEELGNASDQGLITRIHRKLKKQTNH
jgi:hypothetical protein